MNEGHNRNFPTRHGASARWRFFFIPLFLFLINASAQAANYPLELVSPRAAGSSPSSGQPAISATNRIFWAYPGIEYNIRATVIGGKYPYRFALSNAPTGMTINDRTGVIRWTNPTANATPTITVTDSENAQVQSSWSITVDASRFIFIDANNGREFDAPTPGTGTISNPFRRIRDLYSGNVYESKRDGRFANRIAYFRTGAYYIDGFIEDTAGTNAGRMAVMDGVKPVAWLAYPGETPTIDGQCTALSPQIGSRPCNYGRHIAFYDTGHNTYIDGFRVINVAVHAFRTAGTGNYQVFRRNQFLLLGPTVDGVNQSFIATMYGEPGGSYMSIQDNVFDDIEQGSCVKLYSTNRVLIEDNVCRNSQGSESEGFAIKGGEMRRVTVRHNVVDNVFQRGIGGNMHTLYTGEILFNRVINSGATAAEVNQDGVAGEVFVERNTFVGRVMMRSVTTATGPFHFRNNIIVNTDTNQQNQNNIYYYNVSDPSRVQITTNLVGTPDDGIVDEMGVLTGEYLQYRGVHGAEIGDEVWPGPPTAVRAQ